MAKKQSQGNPKNVIRYLEILLGVFGVAIVGFLVAIGIYKNKIDNLEFNFGEQKKEIAELKDDIKEISQKFNDLNTKVNGHDIKIGAITGKPSFVERVEPQPGSTNYNLKGFVESQRGGD
ncbi:hypothetical protein [Bdellovibrio sp. HCB-110]|uniref:hypothetical protein n=1 Tax=Bdellovibrio sp. HCB-110 TaxID=3391182 RepID=UPI0039B663A5